MVTVKEWKFSTLISWRVRVSPLEKTFRRTFARLEKKFCNSCASERGNVKLNYDKLIIREDSYVRNEKQTSEMIQIGKKWPGKGNRANASPRQTADSTFTLVCLNFRSIVNKALDLEHVILSSSPDAVTITETWLTDNVVDHEIPSPNHMLVRKEKPSRGGDVGVLLKSA